MHDSYRNQILTRTDSRANIGCQENAFMPPPPPAGGLGCSFVVVNQLFNVLPIAGGISMFVFVLLCITFCSF